MKKKLFLMLLMSMFAMAAVTTSCSEESKDEDVVNNDENGNSGNNPTGGNEEGGESVTPSAFAWELKDGVLTISGTCAMPNYKSYLDKYGKDSTDAPWHPQRNSITRIVINPNSAKN